MISATAPSSQAAAERSARLRSDGFLAIPGALGPPAVARLAAALDRIYQEEVARGNTRAGAPMHLLGDVGRDDLLLDLVDHPAVLAVIWRELGWNIHPVDPPTGAEPVLASPGDALVFDRRLWHSRSDNLSEAHPSGRLPRLHLPLGQAP